MSKLEKTALFERADYWGDKLSLTHTINNDFIEAFEKAERRIAYNGIYNLVYFLISKWNKVLNKLKIEVK